MVTRVSVCLAGSDVDVSAVVIFHRPAGDVLSNSSRACSRTILHQHIPQLGTRSPTEVSLCVCPCVCLSVCVSVRDPAHRPGWLYVVAWSVCLSVTIVMSLRILTQVDPRNHVLDAVQIPACKGEILRVKMGRSRTWLDTSGGHIATQQGAAPVLCACQLECTRGLHIGATW